jgi:hypothetical protein
MSYIPNLRVTRIRMNWLPRSQAPRPIGVRQPKRAWTSVQRPWSLSTARKVKPNDLSSTCAGRLQIHPNLPPLNCPSLFSPLSFPTTTPFRKSQVSFYEILGSKKKRNQQHPKKSEHFRLALLYARRVTS